MKISFNTQPPEGGWLSAGSLPCSQTGFNTQPPEGGWAVTGKKSDIIIGFNTQPPEGGWSVPSSSLSADFGFNTQPPEGGWGECDDFINQVHEVSTHSRLKAAGSADINTYKVSSQFQHTAA